MFVFKEHYEDTVLESYTKLESLKYYQLWKPGAAYVLKKRTQNSLVVPHPCIWQTGRDHFIQYHSKKKKTGSSLRETDCITLMIGLEICYEHFLA